MNTRLAIALALTLTAACGGAAPVAIDTTVDRDPPSEGGSFNDVAPPQGVADGGPSLPDAALEAGPMVEDSGSIVKTENDSAVKSQGGDASDAPDARDAPDASEAAAPPPALCCQYCQAGSPGDCTRVIEAPCDPNPSAANGTALCGAAKGSSCAFSNFAPGTVVLCSVL